jgi:hypothetical protein
MRVNYLLFNKIRSDFKYGGAWRNSCNHGGQSLRDRVVGAPAHPRRPMRIAMGPTSKRSVVCLAAATAVAAAFSTSGLNALTALTHADASTFARKIVWSGGGLPGTDLTAGNASQFLGVGQLFTSTLANGPGYVLGFGLTFSALLVGYLAVRSSSVSRDWLASESRLR